MSKEELQQKIENQEEIIYKKKEDFKTGIFMTGCFTGIWAFLYYFAEGSIPASKEAVSILMGSFTSIVGANTFGDGLIAAYYLVTNKQSKRELEHHINYEITRADKETELPVTKTNEQTELPATKTNGQTGTEFPASTYYRARRVNIPFNCGEPLDKEHIVGVKIPDNRQLVKKGRDVI